MQNALRHARGVAVLFAHEPHESAMSSKHARFTPPEPMPSAASTSHEMHERSSKHWVHRDSQDSAIGSLPSSRRPSAFSPTSAPFGGLSRSALSEFYVLPHGPGSADSAMTDSTSDSDDGFGSQPASEIGRHALARQKAFDSESGCAGPVPVDRSFSVDSGYMDDSFRASTTSGELEITRELAKAWQRRSKFVRMIESDADDFAEAVKSKIGSVKKFVRNNDWPVTHEIRSEIWKVLCHNKDFDVHKRLYEDQLEGLSKSGVKTPTPLFLSFDGIVVHDHGLKENGAVLLQRLLIVVECVRPEIRYVPILYPLCAMFLHYMGPEETFACVMRLLSQGNGFMLQSEVAVYSSAHTSLALLKRHKRKVYNLLKSRIGTNDDEKLAEVFSDWAAWIFKYLPFHYLVRIIDCFLVEGHKMLLRVVLSLTYVWYKEKGKVMPEGFTQLSVEERIERVRDEIVQVVQECPITISTLLDICTSIRNFKFSTVQRLQSEFEAKHRDKVNMERSLKSPTSLNRTMYTQVFDSEIIDSEVASELMNALPSRFQLETPSLLFRLSENGVSFTQFWNLVDVAEQSLLIIRSTTNEIFGAYCSASWSERKDIRERTRTKYFGTGESFVWALDKEVDLPRIYRWAGQTSDHPEECPQMFMTASDRLLIIGSGGGDAISIRDELTSGLSYDCHTFNSKALVHGNAFDIAELELFNVVSSVD